ncbi:hypothetical protein PDM28_02355 [Stenotrophomonas aracearum]|jgi:TPR repeat protein|uniref:Lipoprotein n=1 Tax=Stenotrophomonas aracearum TaxID=3003272 RepID=A0ABY9YE92_9GAMM|nr:hypothetical protein [Stenotrophomonas sp. A5588]WNH49194.1 hypothetical protein PDM28_02355 [Stenotrophomonas sp. A5588]
MAKGRAVLIGVTAVAAIAGFVAWKYSPAPLPDVAGEAAYDYPAPSPPAGPRMVLPVVALEPSALEKKAVAFQDLKSRAERGERAAQRELADTYATCFSARRTADEVAQGDVPVLLSISPPDAVAVALQIVARRVAECQAVDGGNVFPLIDKWYGEAARQGDLLAQMALIGRGEPIPDPAAATRLVQRVIASNDPEAAFNMGQLILRGHPRTETLKYDKYLEGPISSVAWEITACRMRLDCGPGSTVMEDACLFSGRCADHTYEELARSSYVPPAESESLDQQIEAITRLFKEQCIPPQTERDGVCSLRVE